MNNKYFVRELKKGLPVSLSFLGIAVVIYIAIIFVQPFRPISPHGSELSQILTIGVVILGGVIATILPCFRFSKYMSKRSVDLYYSMPIKRNRLFISDFLASSLELAGIYTTTYLIGFVCIALRAIPYDYQLVYMIPHFFITLVLIFVPFCISAFVFSRAGRILDGVLNIILYNIIFLVLGFTYAYLIQNSSMSLGVVAGSYFLSPVVMIDSLFSYLISHHAYVIPPLFINSTIAYGIIYVLMAIGSVLGILFIPKQADEAGEVSRSYFGYKIILPIFCASLIHIGFCLHYIAGLVFIILAFGFYTFFNRGVKWSTLDYSLFGASIGVGLIFYIISIAQ